MSRNSYRGLTLVVVLIVGLAMALPAAARPAERGLAIQEGLLVRLWNWVEHLWSGKPQQDKELRRVTEEANPACDTYERGPLIDPNGCPK